PECDIITSTTHKTLRGPRGGLIVIGKDFENPMGIVAPKTGRVKMMSEIVDSNVMPGIQGGPLMHIIAAKAVAFGEALKPEFKKYCDQIVKNAATLADSLKSFGFHLVSGGTDNHLILLDLSDRKYSGKKAERILEKAGITVNKNMVPFDLRSPMKTSGIRIGTPAMTTRGMKEPEMKQIASWIEQVLNNINDEQIIGKVVKEILEFTSQFPLFSSA
ncbi:MAG: serine hydroxymethyltransferase, partial [Candidatus Marinimicrobia bacterium]|nr:serine hydroxymethyltransferase [Candidatus Neomarinimicrobiota bacterium]